ncbi:MAG: hypothetical protein Q4C85_07205 [Actinomyces sp.]|uniref:hypothetical protein n=1 Tax=Actinomyces sp. TaxID=29317 RepID=UPI0026DD6860|nr:hypothetical protein [Actinomyces sp.]MDO4243530.1 hypothetical protein [Actinomyces sp.]
MAWRRKKQDWWSAPSQVPTDNGLDTGARSRAARRMRWFVTGSVLTWPVLALALILVVSQTLSGGQEPTSTHTQAEVPSQVRATALEEVTSWLAADPQPLPGATVLGWDRAEQVPARGATPLGWEVWTAYVLASTEEAVYQVAVQVNYSPTAGAEVVGTPSLDLVPPSSQGWSTTDWAGAVPVTVDDATTRAINAWAQAFTSGDSDALTTVVADPDVSHQYVPLSGVSEVQVAVDRAAARATEPEATPDTQTLWVAVRLSITRTGSEQAVEVSYDLLVTGAGTGGARVVAWGPPGTGPTLEAWGNAVTAGRPSTPQSTQTPQVPVPAPSGEATP